MRRQASKASFQDLPQEIQDMIFVLLSRHDAAVCALVCQAWFESFVPILLDSLASTSSDAGPGDGSDVVPEAGTGQGGVGGRQGVRTVLDAYQRMAGWLYSKGQGQKEERKEGRDMAVHQGVLDKASANTGKSAMFEGLLQALEPVMPTVSGSAVEQVLRNSDCLKEVRVSGLWTPVNAAITAAGAGAGVTLQDPSPLLDKRRPPYPLCRMDSLHIVNTNTIHMHLRVKETSLWSLLDCRRLSSAPLPSSCPSSSPSSSSSSPPPSSQDELGLQLSRAATIFMISQNSASLLGALPATLSRLVLETFEDTRVTGMLAASWRTLDNSSSSSSRKGLQEELSTTQVHAKRRSEEIPFQSTQQQNESGFLHLRRIHHSCLRLDKQIFIPFLRRFHYLHEIHLCLSGTMQSYIKISDTLAASCPTLDVGVFGGQEKDISDQDLAVLIGSSAGGWRTLAVDTHCVFGPLSAVAVVRSRHVRKLENLRVTTGNLDFPSDMIQELLCTATRLKRLEGRSLHRNWAPMMHLSAKDLITGEWVCKDLETFHCAIKDIPRPDIKTRKNGRPLVGRMHRGDSMEESFRVQRLVYGQLGRLRKLRELVLGYRSCEGNERFGGFVTDEDWGWEQGIAEADSYSVDSPSSPTSPTAFTDINDVDDGDEKEGEDQEGDEDMPTGLLYDCLAMSLESGLALLGGLTELKWLSLEGTSHCVKDAERKWMATHWPGLFLEDEVEGDNGSGGDGRGGVLRDVFWKKFMICGYHATEPWYNNWEDIEANA
ncbi:hypothetical protein BG015_012020 [Linnemannia schmuckeri]|uniref:F-box domain-containing protein n=1 Tax=Linnemannia schmuckeri TaxID=64567 RepID=A0A9P5RU99_9FUNG|nr:hypothetical protein BG015_012020 [Linnemannia schmuckeri]